MARSLEPTLDAINLNATERRPAWKVEIYDVRSTTDTIGTIVRFNKLGFGSLQVLTGPRDFTHDIASLQIEERRSDFVNGGIQATAVTIVIEDPNNQFDPLAITGLAPGDPGYDLLLGRYLRKRNVIVIREGDTRVDPELWPITFTGEIAGQAGRESERTSGAVRRLTIRALSREANFVKYQRTSQNFTLGNSFLFCAQEIAENEMGLDFDETALSGWGTQLVAHKSLQFVEETPLSMIAKLMFVSTFMPRFRGDGVLTQFSSSVTSSPARVYEDLKLFHFFNRPWNDVEQPNCVTVVGLDGALSKVLQPVQKVASAEVTTGFFTTNEDFKVFWSDDQTQVVENVTTRVLRSVNGGFNALGGGETFTLIPAPGVGGGSVGVRVEIDTGYAPWLATFFLATYVTLTAIPDLVQTIPFEGSGFTIQTGSIIAGAALATALLLMTRIARGQYEFIGEPLEYVYKELRSQACVDGISAFDENQLTIENHLVNTAAAATVAAREALFLLQAQENPRSISMIHDLKLEPGDIFEVPTGQRYLVDSIQRTLKRDANEAIRAALTCFEVTLGVLA